MVLQSDWYLVLKLVNNWLFIEAGSEPLMSHCYFLKNQQQAQCNSDI